MMWFKPWSPACRLGLILVLAVLAVGLPVALGLVWFDVVTRPAASIVGALAGLTAAAGLFAWRLGVENPPAGRETDSAAAGDGCVEHDADDGVVLLAAHAARLQRMCHTIRDIGGNAAQAASDLAVAVAEEPEKSPATAVAIVSRPAPEGPGHGGSEPPAEGEARAVAEDGRVDAAVREMETIAASVDHAARQIKQLLSELHRVSSIATVIGEVASQTDFLAFNAAMEAARAGPRGRSLAAAAQSVRDLAQSTTAATERMEKTILSIQMEAGGAQSTIAQVGRQVRRSVELVQGGRERPAAVDGATERRANGPATIAEHIERIVKMVQGSSASLQSAAAATAELEREAHALSERISRFRP